MVHELRNDTDWVNFKRSLVRAPQIIRQKLSSGGEQLPPDETFDLLHSKFMVVEQLVKTLDTEVSKYTVLTKLFLLHSVGIAKGFSAVFEPSLSISPLTASSADARLHKCFDLTVVMDERLRLINERVEPILDLILNNARESVSKLLVICRGIKHSIRERDFIILDVNRYMGHVSLLDSKKQEKLSLKQEQNLVRYQKNLELSNIKYERINSLLKLELPKFFELVSAFIRPFHLTLYFLQLNIYYELLGLNETAHERLKLKTKECQMTPNDFAIHLIEDYTKAIGNTELKIDQLMITKSVLERQTLQLNGTFKSLLVNDTTDVESRADTQASIRTPLNYCTLKFNYTAQQDGDLSFVKDERILILDQTFNNDWWKGKTSNGAIDLFPRNYVDVD